MIENTSMKKLHACLMLLACEIKRICEKNDICYFLIAGSLLGAIRHNEIIPWDDDLDVAMPREDYNRFLKACETELKEDFLVCNQYTEKKYGSPYTKLRLKNTIFKDYGVPNTINNGIFVDIFPLDRVPEDKAARKKQAFHVKIWRNAMQAKCGYGGMSLKTTLRVIVLLPLCILPKKYICSRSDYWQTKYNHGEGEYVNFTSAYKPGREIYPKSAIQRPLPEHVFGGVQFSIPAESDYLLKTLYGDYMKFPPVGEREPKHCTSDIDFGPYDNILDKEK